MKRMHHKDRKQLLYAARNGKFWLLRKILSAFNVEDVRDDKGNTPLILAAGKGHARIAMLLLEYGADIHARNADGENALILACREAHPRMARLLLERGALFEPLPAGNRQALALLKPEENTILEALNMTTFPVYEDNDSWNSITAQTAKWRSERIIKLIGGIFALLITAGAEVNVNMDSDGSTPLHFAIQNKLQDLALLLLKHGADPNTGRGSDTPLQASVRYNSCEIMRMLIEHGADLNSVDGCGYTPLASACIGNEKLASILLASGANPDGGVPKNKPDFPSLCYNRPLLTVCSGHMVSIDFLKELISFGADVNIRDVQGRNALHHAVGRGVAANKITQILLDAGADPTAVTVYGYSVADYAMQASIDSERCGVPAEFRGPHYHYPPPPEYPIINFDKNHAGFVKAALQGDQAALATLIDGIPGRIKAIALVRAIAREDISCCRLLLDHGADPNAVDIDGHLPLCVASGCFAVEIAELLLNYGADVEATDYSMGRKPLFNAFASRRPFSKEDTARLFKMAKLLLASGADVNGVD